MTRTIPATQKTNNTGTTYCNIKLMTAQRSNRHLVKYTIIYSFAQW